MPWSVTATLVFFGLAMYFAYRSKSTEEEELVTPEVHLVEQDDGSELFLDSDGNEIPKSIWLKLEKTRAAEKTQRWISARKFKERQNFFSFFGLLCALFVLGSTCNVVDEWVSGDNNSSSNSSISSGGSFDPDRERYYDDLAEQEAQRLDDRRFR
jgi:hypothetical protein